MSIRPVKQVIQLKREPVARYGPIVMKTQQELQPAFLDLQQGKFLKQERLLDW